MKNMEAVFFRLYRRPAGCDRYGNIGRIMKIEQRSGNDADLVADPRQERDAFAGCTGVFAGGGRFVGQYQIGSQHTQSAGTGKAVKRLHQRRQQLVQQINYAEL